MGISEILREKFNIPLDKTYFLSVCTIEPRKNIDLLINAYEKLLSFRTREDIPLLILTGIFGWKVQPLIEKINRINNCYENPIILTGFVSDEDLAILYSATSAFVYPSLYEGFGLPPLEAMQCGAPVIASNNSSIPEVVGDAGILVDAQDEKALVDALRNCLNKEKSEEMRQRSIKRAALFSWGKTTSDIVNILNELN